MDVPLQSRIAQIVKRIAAADQLIELEDCLTCPVMPRQGTQLSHKGAYLLPQAHDIASFFPFSVPTMKVLFANLLFLVVNDPLASKLF
jgi:hypothetical protein